MNRIRVLTEHTANKIAAGEVIERPASVVKELVENSLDAEANEILVEVKSGGKNLIRVTDDGIGMNRDDAVLCLERHSTSKIRDADDLEKVSTMGFRGEAIPSIASVSKFSITTCPRDEGIGTFVKVDGGRTVNVIDVGRSPGTTIEVRRLFFNVPARRKFMRSVEREMAEIARVMDIYALANPNVHFQLLHNDKTVMLAPSTRKIGERIIAVFGRQFFTQLLPLEFAGKNVRITGYVGKPELNRSSRSHQFLFVNRRPIFSPPISYAVSDAYKNILMKDRYPVFILFLEVKPETIDVNVHPTKREIRFKNEWDVKDEITSAVKETLLKMDLTPYVKTVSADIKTIIEKTSFEKQLVETEKNIFLQGLAQGETVQAIVSQQQKIPDREISAKSLEEKITQEIVATSGRKSLNLRFLSQLKNSYILAEDAEGLVLIDQHAAHERILYERLSKIIQGEGVRIQQMLVPITLELSSGEASLLEANLSHLRHLGFDLRLFGSNTYIIDAVPEYIKTAMQEKVIRDILDSLKQERRPTSTEREEAVQYAVCRAAVKAHDELSETEVLKLIKDLNECESPYTCPHGRPTMLRMPMKDIEKYFHRR